MWVTKEEQGLRRNLLAHSQGILKRGPWNTPFATAEVAKKGLKELKRFARSYRSRGLNPQRWAYFGGLRDKVANWEAEAGKNGKEASEEDVRSN